MKKHLIYISILLLVFSCNTIQEKPEKVSRIIRVKVQKAEPKDYTETVSGSGILTRSQQMKLSFKTGGLIKSIQVNEGQEVKKDMTLANLDLSEVNAMVQQAKVAYDKAYRDYKRAKNLYADSVATLETLQNARSAFELAKAQKQIAEFNKQHSVIKAPVDGKILKVLVEKNEMIGPGYPVLLFASTENNWIIRTALADKDIVKLQAGDSASVQMDAFPGENFPAKVSELGVIADPVTGTYEAELRLDTARVEFRTGFISRARIYTSQHTHGLWLPMEAIVDAADKRAYVFVAEDSMARRKEVRLGPIVDGGILLLEGVSEEEMIITVGANYLRDGEEIIIVNPEEE